MRRANLLAFSALAGVISTATGATAGAGDPTFKFDIPAESLSQALMDVSEISSQQLIYSENLVRGQKTVGLHGTYTAPQALNMLLAGTSLIAEANPAGVLMVEPKNAEAAASDEGAAKFEGASVETVTVTAEKRSELLQDTPVPVTVLSAESLVNNNQVRIQDYFSSVPGLDLSPAPGPNGETMLAIRGIATGVNTNPTVGITIDDVPFGSSTSIGDTIPDLDPGDLSNIEVLRGPQGTLYGASSMGGLIKYVTADPSTDSLFGSLNAGVSSVYNGSEPGYSFRGAINAPLSDTLAVRGSAFVRLDPGYVNNVVTGVDGVNRASADGGFFSALWQPTQTLSLKIDALLQQSRADGSDDVDVQPGLNDLQQNDLLRGAGGYHRSVQFYSATLKADLGDVDLTSTTGYNIYKFASSMDNSYSLGGLAALDFGVDGVPIFANSATDKFTQEVRFSGTVWTNIDWLVGGFYTHENTSYLEFITAENPATSQEVGSLLNYSAPTTYAEYAGFADVTVHFSNRFDVQIGGRESYIAQSSSPTVVSGPLVGGLVISPEVQSNANAFTYLLTPRFKLSSDLMAYVRLASGYRAGGPNASNPDPTTPRQYNPDKTENYEVGAKGDIDQVLTYDISLYYINWNALQLNLLDPKNFVYTTNGSQAKSEGVELSVETKPRDGLTVSAWLTYDDAELTEALPAASTLYGVAGDRLPFSAQFSGHLSLEQDFPLTNDWTGFAGATAIYVGDRLGSFTPSTVRTNFPAYGQINLRLGATSDLWTVNVYANNIGDTRGLLGGGLENFPPFAYRYIEPRLIGLSVTRNF